MSSSASLELLSPQMFSDIRECEIRHRARQARDDAAERVWAIPSQIFSSSEVSPNIRMAIMLLSIVIPVLNEAEIIPSLLARIREALPNIYKNLVEKTSYYLKILIIN